jgi:ureidoglycolate lyase
MNRLAIRSNPNAQDIAPFGALIHKPAGYGQRQFYSDWLGGAGLEPVFHVNSIAPSALPAELSRLERHRHAAQCFIPLDVERYLVTVAPSRTDGSPDLDNLKSFVLPGTQGIVYERGVWHAGAMVLDRPGAFAVLMWRGRPDDDEFLDIGAVTMTMEDFVK